MPTSNRQWQRWDNTPNIEKTKKRVGFQFELGAWMHGKPTIKSSSEVSYDPSAEGIDGVGDVMSKIQFWPQMTFRLTGRIL